MEQVEIAPIGRSVSCLGLGCARLDGRADLKRSARIIETALDLGITYFDVAASYAAGTAEEAVGHVIGGSEDVVVTTKVGPPVPPYNAAKMRLKTAVRPALDRARTVKLLLRRAVAPPTTAPADRPRYDFSHERVQRSLERSLEKLRRDRVDILLAHEPNRADLVPELEASFQSLVDQQLIGAFGVGVDVREDRWARFGTVWQSGWPGEGIAEYANDASYLFHGVLRYAPKDTTGRTTTPPAELIRTARAACPRAVLLVSASTPARLRELVKATEL